MKLTVGAVQQAWIADRVISLTDSGNIRKRDSLLKAVSQSYVSQQISYKDDDEESDGDGEPPLSTVELVQGLVLGALPKDPASTSNDHAPISDTAVYKYYVGIAGRRRFLIFILMCAIFVAGITFNRWVSLSFSVKLDYLLRRLEANTLSV